MSHDEEYALALVAHRARLAQIEAEGEAELARIAARIEAAHVALDKLGAKRVSQ